MCILTVLNACWVVSSEEAACIGGEKCVITSPLPISLSPLFPPSLSPTHQMTKYAYQISISNEAFHTHTSMQSYASVGREREGEREKRRRECEKVRGY